MIEARRARPILASHAPRVKIIRIKYIMDILQEVIIIIINDKIINSKNKRTINKWFCWIEIAKKAEKATKIKNKDKDRGIVLRNNSVFDLQDQCFFKAFKTQETKYLIFNSQS